MLSLDMAKFLAHHGKGILGQTLFFGKYVPDPDNCIVIFDGSTETNVETNVVKYAITIAVRNFLYVDGYTIALSVHNLIHNKENLFAGVSGVTKHVGYAFTKELPRYEGEDPRKRHVWVVDCYLFAVE